MAFVCAVDQFITALGYNLPFFLRERECSMLPLHSNRIELGYRVNQPDFDREEKQREKKQKQQKINKSNKNKNKTKD